MRQRKNIKRYLKPNFKVQYIFGRFMRKGLGFGDVLQLAQRPEHDPGPPY